jgi:hypothetical protein
MRIHPTQNRIFTSDSMNYGEPASPVHCHWEDGFCHAIIEHLKVIPCILLLMTGDAFIEGQRIVGR